MESERCRPLFYTDSTRIVDRMQLLQLRVVLICIAMVVLQAVLELGVTLRRRVVLHMIDGVGSWVNLPVTQSANDFIWGNLNEEV